MSRLTQEQREALARELLPLEDDLISRQAAIQEIKDLPDCQNGYSDTYDKAQIIGVLEELSSAQPEQRWIPCSDRLPEYLKPYLCCIGDWVGILIYRGCGIWHKPNGTNAIEYLPSAWQPLPEPYKEKTE